MQITKYGAPSAANRTTEDLDAELEMLAMAEPREDTSELEAEVAVYPPVAMGAQQQDGEVNPHAGSLAVPHSLDGASEPLPYSFAADLHGQELQGESEGVVAQLDQLCRSRTSESRIATPYMLIRKSVCIFNVAMNIEGVMPPAFRPSRKVPRSALTADQMLLAKDRMVTDLHWLHERGFRQELNDGVYRDLMVHQELDLAQLEEFVSRKWTNRIRVEKVLGLTELEQLQLGVLISNEVRDKRTAVLDRAAKVKTLLRSKVQAGARLPAHDIEDLVRLWIADQLCPGASQQVVGRLHGWQCGRAPLAKQTLSEKLKRMRKWTV